MEFSRLWALRGPNIWARVPVIEVEVVEGNPSCPPDFGLKLAQILNLPPDEVSERRTEELRKATHPTKALPYVALELQCLTGCDVAFAATRPGPTPGLIRIAFEYEEEPLGRACLESARQLCMALVDNKPFDLAGALAPLLELAYEVRLGPSTAAIVRGARRRSIPTQRLNDGNLVQLGHGARARRIWAAETDQTGALAEAIAKDKVLTCSLLRSLGIPVPEGRTVTDSNDAWLAAQEIGMPVVVKPRDGNHGRGVATNLLSENAVRQAFAAAQAESNAVLVEKYLPGVDYRLLVIGYKLVAAALREPAQVVGDGQSTVNELIAEANRDPRRSDGHATALSFIKLDVVALAVLAEQGYNPDAVPQQGAKVLIRRNGNLSTGGTATDVTDQAHPAVAARAIEAARLIGLDIAGVDVVTPDITRPLEEVGGGIVEVNAGPGLRMHQEPSAGKPRPVGEAIVNLLFPEGSSGRIPIAAVTGVNGKTTTIRLLAHLLREAGHYVGMTCTDGSFIQDRRIDAHDCSGPRSARSILLHPRVDAAVLETARGGILREGLGFDQCDVAIVTNIGSGDHLGLRGVVTLEELAQVKRTVVEAVAPGGASVLNAGDPLVAAMASHCPGSVIFFARSPDQPVLLAHRGNGGRAVFVQNGLIILATGAQTETLISLEEVPLAHHGRVPFQIENVLAASAAAWALGLPLETIRSGLRSFTGNTRQSPGRFNVFSLDTATVVVDYAHNPAALAALLDGLDAFSHQRRTVVFTAFDRRDEDVILIGELIGKGFDRVLLVQDRGNRERADGDLNILIRQGLSRASRVKEVEILPDETTAITTAMASLRPDDLLVIGIEAIEEALAVIEDLVSRKRCDAVTVPIGTK